MRVAGSRLRSESDQFFEPSSHTINIQAIYNIQYSIYNIQYTIYKQTRPSKYPVFLLFHWEREQVEKKKKESTFPKRRDVLQHMYMLLVSTLLKTGSIWWAQASTRRWEATHRNWTPSWKQEQAHVQYGKVHTKKIRCDIFSCYYPKTVLYRISPYRYFQPIPTQST